MGKWFMVFVCTRLVTSDNFIDASISVEHSQNYYCVVVIQFTVDFRARFNAPPESKINCLTMIKTSSYMVWLTNGWFATYELILYKMCSVARTFHFE